MEIKKGIGVSPGVVIGTALVLDAEDLAIPKRQVAVAGVDAEMARLDLAIQETIGDLTKLRDDIVAKQGRDIAGIFDFHIGILRDPSVIKPMQQEITANHRPRSMPSVR